MARSKGVRRRSLKRKPLRLSALAATAERELVAGQLKQANQICIDALRVDDRRHEFLYIQGRVALERGDNRAAQLTLQRAAEVAPRIAEYHFYLGEVYCRLERFSDAIEAFQRALALEGNYAAALNSLGTAFQCNGNPEDAIRCFREATARKRDFAAAHANLGVALYNEGRYEDAIDACRSATSLQPNLAEAHLTEGLACLRTGELDIGWAKYEWRWQADESNRERAFPQPIWNGSSLDGRTILIWGEQGVGDEIMFAGFLPEIARQAARCLLECEPRLSALLSRSLPTVEVFARCDPPAPKASDPGVDVQSSAGSLLRWLRPTPDSFRPSPGYLAADPDLTGGCMRRYRALGNGLKVGISWRSGNKQRGQLRSAPLELWTPLFRLPDVCFISLQYGDCADELQEIRARYGVNIYLDEHVDALASLEDFAAQVAALDLVVSIDNTTVHMAGALGKPVWILLPRQPEWRWEIGGQDSVWYSTARIFRQHEAGDWSHVFSQVADELSHFTVVR